ncbi:MAG: RAD55 family ATPase [Haloferacaceae archaeon]
MDGAGRSADGGGPGERRSTGIAALDRALGGGVRPGSLVAVVGGPAAPTEPVLYAVAAPRPTRYLTALRPADEVEAALDRHGAGGATVGRVDGDELLADPGTHLGGIDDGATVVVDPITDAEQGGREDYRRLLAAGKRALRRTGGVAVLHCFETTPPTLRRDLTLARADHVWRIDLTREGEPEVLLTVRKARGHDFPSRRFVLDVAADGVTATAADGQ